MKEEVKGDDELADAFVGETAADVAAALEGSERGPAVPRASASSPYRQEFGYKAIWSHEFVYPTWHESRAPIVEAVRGYLETDYDYPAALAGRAGTTSRPPVGADGRRARGRGARAARRRRSTSRCG